MCKATETYLVLRFRSVGNVAMTVPVVASAAALSPHAQFVVVADKRLGDMFLQLDNVHFHCADTENGNRKSVVRLFRELRRNYNITGVIDLQNNHRSRMLDFLYLCSRVRITRLGTNYNAQRRLCRKGYAESEPMPDEFSRYASVFAKAGLTTDNSFSALPLNTDADKAVTERFGKKMGRWIGIAPFAKSKTNMLPYRTTKEVITHFAAQEDTRVFLFGAGRVECEMLKQWAALSDRIDSVAGVLELAEELELMRRLDFMLCMDSANQHLASLVGLRCVSVWCGTHPYAGFYGWKQRAGDIIQQPLSCRPCTIHGRSKCKYRNFLCRQFSPVEIIEGLEVRGK